MRTINCLIIILLLVTLKANTQSIKIELKEIEDTIPKYEFTGIGINQTYFKVPYAGYKISNPSVMSILNGKTIEKIDLIYTAYPATKDLTKLNKRRLAHLYTLMPEIFENDVIKWRVVRQTQCKTAQEARNMFHGFAIT